MNSCNYDQTQSAYSLFDTNIIYDNLTRAEFFRHNPTYWRFGSLTVMADSIDINYLLSLTRFSSDKINLLTQLQANIEFVKKVMIIEIVISRNAKLSVIKDAMEQNSGFDETSVISAANNRFLCVFSDGTTVISQKSGTDYSENTPFGFVIQCDMTNELLLKFKIYSQTMMKLMNNVDDNNYNITTNIGVTIFSLNPKQNIEHLMHEYIISMNVKLPVCGFIQVNRRPSVYFSESQYVFDPNNTQFELFSNIPFLNNKHEYQTATNSDEFKLKSNQLQPHANENINTDRDSINAIFADIYQPTRQQYESTLDFKYFLSICNTIHPRSRSGQMDILLLQWFVFVHIGFKLLPMHFVCHFELLT